MSEAFEKWKEDYGLKYEPYLSEADCSAAWQAACEYQRGVGAEMISVMDRLPDDKIETFTGGPEGSWGTSVLARIDSSHYIVAYFAKDENQFFVTGRTVKPTHWFPCPSYMKAIREQGNG